MMMMVFAVLDNETLPDYGFCTRMANLLAGFVVVF